MDSEPQQVLLLVDVCPFEIEAMICGHLEFEEKTRVVHLSVPGDYGKREQSVGVVYWKWNDERALETSLEFRCVIGDEGEREVENST